MADGEARAACAEGAGGGGEAARGEQPRDPYAALVALSERKLVLAREARVDELHELADEWRRLTAALPARPPASARAALARASALHAETRLTLLALRETTLGGLRAAARASRAAHGYANSGASRPGHVDRDA